MTSSGTYGFSLSNSEIVLEAFDKIEIRPPAITGAHMISAKRSLNLELQRFSVAGVPLMWAIDVISINLVQGVTTYTLPPETADLLDVYIRQYTLANTFNVAPDISITLNSTAVTVAIANHGLIIGNFINFVIPVSIGNILLSGFYEVVTVPTSGTLTITSSVAATSSVADGGAVPLFTPTSGLSTVQVTSPNNGQAVNNYYTVPVSTTVGGITLYGSYLVSAIIDANNFIISALQSATSSVAAYENSGFAQIQAQSSFVNPIDYIMTPLGRTDYASIPDKSSQGRPTSYNWDRTANQSVTLWQVPDGNGPYQLQAYRMRRLQDASFANGQTPDIVYRAMDALCDQMALRLAMKYAKQMIPVIKPVADASWEALMTEDRERAQIMLLPDFTSYYR